MSNLSKGNTLLILQFHLYALTNIIFAFFLILNTTTGPIRVNFNSEILILLQKSINLESQVMLLISQKNLQ